MAPDDWITSHRDIRRECDTQVAAVIFDLMDKGWRLRRSGHEYKLYCPCGGRDGAKITVNGSPQNANTHARRVARQAALCLRVNQQILNFRNQAA